MKRLIGWVVALAGMLGVAQAASSLDPTFNIGTGANGLVEQVLPLSNGKILICGNFTAFNGRNRAYMARLNSDGSVDETFFAQPSYWVRNMSVQADGRIVIGGFFRQVQGVSRSLIARLNADGTLDTSFNPGTGVTDVMYAGVDGNVDPFVFWTAVQADGKILATGNFRNYNGAASWGLVRINPDGSRDTTFNVGGGLDSWGRHINVLPNNQILVSGWFGSYRGAGFNRVARINPDGSPDTTFQPFFGDRTAIYSTALVANNKYIVAGHSLNTNGLFLREMARLNPNGSFDESFIGRSNEKTESVVIQPDGKIIIGGYFSAVNGVPRRYIARLHSDGSLDDSLQANIDNFVWSCALQGDGKLLISGGFYTVDGQSRNGVARLLTGLTGGTPPPDPTPTPSPAPVLTARADSSSQITLTWTDAATDRAGYSVERKTGANGTYESIATLSASARSFVNSGLAPSTTYYYRLQATTTARTASYSNEAAATTQAAPTPTGTASAAYIGADTSTRGSWRGVYGGEGYHVMGETYAYPAYARVTPVNKSDWVWTWSTADTRAVQRANGTDRIAACWYANATFSIDLSITDGQRHRVSLYFLDWDNGGRRGFAQVTDASNGAILDQRSLAAYGGGIYLTWEIGGSVRINITPQAGNAVVSGLFFGASQTPPQETVATPTISPNGGTYTAAQNVALATATAGAEIRYTVNGSEPTATSTLYSAPFSVSATSTVKAKAFKAGMLPSATASAAFTINPPTGGGGGGGGGTGANFVFVGSDSTTRGNWRGVYGADGYNVLGHSAQYPLNTYVSAAGKQDWVWNSTTSDARGLQTPSGTSRIAGCWYAPTSFTFDVNISDGVTRRVALYFCDWDYAGRTQLLELIDPATGAVAHSQTVANFAGGNYLIWDVKGRMRFRLTRQAGPNAVVNGIFFSAPARQL